MKINPLSLMAIGAVLASLSVPCSANAGSLTPSRLDDQQSAQLLADLISKGHVVIDANTGRMTVKSSVVDILKSYNLLTVERTDVSEMNDDGKTGGTGRP